jgi:hypothetical protein
MSAEPISPELALIDPTLAKHPRGEARSMIDSFESEHAAASAPTAAPAGPDAPSVEALLFAAGAITADQLGELVRDAVLTQRPVAALAVERGFATKSTVDALLAGTGAPTSPTEAVAVAEDPAPAEPAVLDLRIAPSIVAAVEPIVAEVTHEAAPVVEPAEAVPVAVAEPEPAPAAPAPQVALAPSVEETVRAVALAAQPTLPAPLPADLEEAAPAPAASVAPAGFAVFVRLQSGEQVKVGTADTFEQAAERARAVAETVSGAGEWPFASGRLIRPETIVSIDIERALEG